MHRIAGILTALVFSVSSASMAWSQEAPTEATVAAILEKFRTERAEAVKTFSAAELATADEMIQRAELALKEQRYTLAARLVRDARWAVPFLPSNLPPNVSRIMSVSRLRHSDRITGLSFSPDGSKLASSSRDGTVRIWDLGNGRELLAYRGHMEATESPVEKTNVFKVANVVFSPDGSLFVCSGSQDIHVVETRTGVRKQVLKGHTGAARGLAFATNAASMNTLVSGGDDRRVIIWDVRTGKAVVKYPPQSSRIEAVAVGVKGRLFATVNSGGELHVYPLTNEVKASMLAMSITEGGETGNGVAFVGDTSGIVTGGGDNEVRLTMGPDLGGTTAGNGIPVRKFTGHKGKVVCLSTTAAGKWIVSGSADGSVCVWETSSGKLLWTFQGHNGPLADGRESGVTAVAMSPDEQLVASGGIDGVIHLWRLTKEDDNRKFSDATDSLWSVATSPDGKRFATSGADRLVRVYNMATNKLEATLKGHRGSIPALTFLGNNRIASGSGDKLVKLWDLATGNATDLSGHSSAVLAVAADDAGQMLVTGSVDHSVRAWDASGKPLWTWTGKSAVCALAIRKDTKRVAVGTADGTLTILNTSTMEPKVASSIGAQTGGVSCVTFHPDGSRVATCGGDGSTRIWAVTDSGPLTPVGKLEPASRTATPAANSPLSAVAYSYDGTHLATAGAESEIRIWDAQTFLPVRGFRAHTDWVTAVAFSRDNSEVLSASVDKSARAFTRNQFSTASAPHTGSIQCVAVSEDGQFLATGSSDRSVKIWNLRTGQQTQTLVGSTDSVHALAFGKKNELVAGGADKQLRWWSIDTGRVLRTATAGGIIFGLSRSATEDKWAFVWNRDKEKVTSFEQCDNEAHQLSSVFERGRDVTSAIVSADTTLGIAGGDDGTLRTWDLRTKDLVGADWPITTHKIVDIALTSDNKTVIVIDSRGSVKVADRGKRTASEPFNAVKGTVVSLVLSPTNDKFATLAADGEVKTWSLAGKELRSWKLNVTPATATFLPDGRKLIVGNRDGSVYVLEMP